MVNTKRHEKIVSLLMEYKMLGVKDLSKIFHTSMMTIRRDLSYLETKGVLKKIHGGAVLEGEGEFVPTFFERVNFLNKEKEAIGKAAASIIKPNDIVYFDAGTTTLATIKYIPEKLKFTAITTGIMAAAALSKKSNVHLIIIGGNVHEDSLSTIGNMAIEQIKKFNADIGFFSTKGISIDEGAFELLLPLIEVKQAMQGSSKKTILLADHTKFTQRSLSVSLPIDKIDIIVTDHLSQKDFIKKLEEMKKEVIIANDILN